MEYVSVADAAQSLRVSSRRVRQLLEDGSLGGQRIGGRWLIARNELERRLQASPPPGRPLSSASAWHVLAALSEDHEELTRLPPPLRSRVRSRAARLRQLPLDEVAKEWRSTLRRRAAICEFYAHSSVLADLLNDPKVVRSGISAAYDHGADLMVVGGAEGYVQARNLSTVAKRYALNPASAPDANVRLHTVDTGADWLFRHRVAPAAVVAADLLDRDESRDRTAGAKLAASL
jgi:excisionase family DNA binding protein